MIKCLRCQNTVDATRQAACPVCLAPLAAPVAAPGQGMPVFTPPPGSGTPPARSVPAPTPARSYAPPPGSPYTPPPAAAYAPPPGSPYSPPPLPSAPPVPNAVPFPPYGQTPPIPGYAPPANTRTTLTGEVVETSAPVPGYGPSYAPGNYAPLPGTAPYGNPYPIPAPTRPQPAAAPTRSWNPLNWKLAGGGTFTALYIAARLFAIFARNMHPATPISNDTPLPPPSYSSGMGQSYPSRSSIPSFTPPAPYRNNASTLPQAPTYMPPNLPTRPTFPSRFQQPNMPNMPTPNFPSRFQQPGMPNMPTPPHFPSHFQPPNMPNMPTPPRGFSGPSNLPGRGSFGMPSGDRFGNP